MKKSDAKLFAELHAKLNMIESHLITILVQLDGYKAPRTYHHALFNPVRGQKLF